MRLNVKLVPLILCATLANPTFASDDEDDVMMWSIINVAIKVATISAPPGQHPTEA